MGPTGELLQPLGVLTFEEAKDAFAEQARGLAEGGADVLWVETMSAGNETEAAAAGAATTGLPVVTTMTFDTNGRTMMGLTPAEAARLFHDLYPRLVAFGSNCGTGPAELVASIIGLAKASVAGADIIIAKGNCGIPEYVEGKIKFSGTPELMAEYARLARDAGGADYRRLLRPAGAASEGDRRCAEGLCSAGGAGSCDRGSAAGRAHRLDQGRRSAAGCRRRRIARRKRRSG